MPEKLLVRTYNVGFGDCIYIQVPDNGGYFNILVDCGTSGAEQSALKPAIDDVGKMLSVQQEAAGAGKSGMHLDLLVITHPHADHIKGFNPKYFKNIAIKNIWMSVFMRPDHPQAGQAQALAALADRSARRIQSLRIGLSPEVQGLLERGVCNKTALDALRVKLPGDNGITPLYVYRDVAKREKKLKKKHHLRYTRGTTCFEGFKDKSTRIRVLAPEWDIDGYYLGTETDYQAILGVYDSPMRVRALEEARSCKPRNISETDFRTLRDSLLGDALGFAQDDNDLKNNTSVVFLLEWKGRRLLFTGDAEWDGKGVQKGRRSSCWDVLLAKDKTYGHLARRVDFLKVAHHGSVNGTPFFRDQAEGQPVLDKLLPKESGAQIVVSTQAGKHGEEYEVPYPALLKELGRRAANARSYQNHPDMSAVKQPARTDREEAPIDTLIQAAG
jgi:beta-lactamase superfamily II metal-dependent hydrolase